MSKSESTLKRFENKNSQLGLDRNGGKHDPANGKNGSGKCVPYKHWNFVAPKDGEPKTKMNHDSTYYWCHKSNGKSDKPMWCACKPSDHKGSNANKSTPKSDSSVEF